MLAAEISNAYFLMDECRKFILHFPSTFLKVTFSSQLKDIFDVSLIMQPTMIVVGCLAAFLIDADINVLDLKFGGELL